MPADLERYEKLYPGITKVLMDERIAQAAHRRELEHAVVFSGIAQARMGLYCGALFLLSIVALCFYAVAHGQGASGILLAVGAILAGVGTYLFGTHQSREERQEKNKEIVKAITPPAEG